MGLKSYRYYAKKSTRKKENMITMKAIVNDKDSRFIAGMSCRIDEKR